METRLNHLSELSLEIRKAILQSLAEAGSGHTGGSLDLVDIFTCLYFGIMRHDPAQPRWEDRDRLILSIGHVAPVLYATLAFAGYFPKEELLTLRKLGSRLQGHPGREHGLPGLELSAGSLGQGLSVAVGLALGARMDKKAWRTYSIHGDGELQEGSVWEAAMSAAHHKLDNLTALVDRNGVQIDGKTSEVMDPEPLNEKWKAFGWHVISCNGHDHQEIIRAYQEARQMKGRPSVILAKTIMGKGVPSIEGDFRWHGKAPTREQAAGFIRELY
ncbi:MAG TPA: transketolase [Bacteroidales bacterium]|nr:transketolase [Bacteroidales bacterium]HRZ21273.1 transketolase [Bacteroidales bacterium]